MSKDKYPVLLTEKEREDVYKYWLHSSTLTNEDGLIQLAEKAVLEKLAGMEMPEPTGFRMRYRSEPGMIGHYPWSYADQGRRQADRPEYEREDLFTAAQLRQAFAQGAASVLSAPK